MAPRPPPKERAPLLPKSVVVTDAASIPADKGKKVDDNEPVTPVAGSSGLSLEEKLAALALANDNGLDDEFSDDDSDTELEFEVSKDSTATLRYTAILLLPLVLQPEIALVIVTARMLLKRVWSALLSDEANTLVDFQDIHPAYVAKTKYSRLQLSFLKEADAIK
ncbi:unnamed protein product, partial [Closterium sp. NIES-54]